MSAIISGAVFDPSTPETDGATKSLPQLLLDYLRSNQIELHTSFPAQILSIDAPGIVTIQPSIKRTFVNGQVLPLTALKNVPVRFPRGGGYSVRYPIAVGDSGLAVISERSLDIWKLQGGTVDPKDNRLHNLSDAVFFPGLYPTNDPIPVTNASALEVTVGEAFLSVQPGGRFLFKGASQELMDLLDQTLALLKAVNNELAIATVNTLLGPQQLNDAERFGPDTLPTSFAGQAATLETKLDTLKGT